MFTQAYINLRCKIAEVQVRRELKNHEQRQAEYDAMIAASQAKLAETTLVPGFTKIYA
jgi:hypothetical protein